MVFLREVVCSSFELLKEIPSGNILGLNDVDPVSILLYTLPPLLVRRPQ